MKKIILSSFLVLAFAALVSYATYSYFSDRETSTGNTFTAGELDLKFQVEGATAQWTDVNGTPIFDGVTFPLGDMKPGDKGEKTVRLWVDDNPSCGKVSVNVTEDQDNSCTGPELIDDPTCVASANGELNDAVNFAVWSDPNCNNILDGTAAHCANVNYQFCAQFDQQSCESMAINNDCAWVPATTETILTSGPLTGNKAYSIGEIPTLQANAKCYGVAYCFGAWNGTTCNGAAINSASQSDSFKADIIIDALQKRNQFPNGCPAVGDWPPS
jgi:predicted ribosomally synthesized peptide with SipW-like signal peptide